MGIQIDGSANTISGLAVGGLPNGSISSDDIASNAVTVDKLASTLDLSSNTVTLPNTSVTAGMLASTLDISGKTVTLPNTSVTAGMLASTLDLSGKTVTLPSGTGGKILQVVTQTDNTEYDLTPNTTPTNVSGLNCSITPSASTSKILVILSLGCAQAGASSNGNLGYGKIRYDHSGISEADATPIGLNDVAGSSKMHFAINLEQNEYKAWPTHFTLLHSPSTTNEITYKLYVWTEGSPGIIKINRTVRNNSIDYSALSTLTLMEVAG